MDTLIYVTRDEAILNTVRQRFPKLDLKFSQVNDVIYIYAEKSLSNKKFTTIRNFIKTFELGRSYA